MQVAVGTGGGACEGQSETGDTEGTRGTWVGNVQEAEKDAVRPEEPSAQMRGEREEKGPGVNVEQCLVRKGLSEGGRGDGVPFESKREAKGAREGRHQVLAG